MSSILTAVALGLAPIVLAVLAFKIGKNIGQYDGQINGYREGYNKGVADGRRYEREMR